MAQENFEQKISEALKLATDKPSKELHDETFQAIMRRIDKNDKGDRKMLKRKSKIGKIITIGTTAAVILLALTFNTQPGQAALERIREYFEPEKSIVTEIEGTEEVIDSKLQESEMGYVLYFDQERYKVSTIGDVDRIELIEKADYIPDVYMEISQDKNRLPAAVAKDLEAALKEEFDRVDEIQTVTEPVDGLFLHAINGGKEWDDVVVTYYLVDNTRGGTFVIKQQYFLEASEGHGARFKNMLKEFVIIPVE